MVNRIQKLLVNQKSIDSDIEARGDYLNYLPFRQVVEHPDVVAVKKILFGSKPDRFTYNFRGDQYLKLLEDYVDLDTLDPVNAYKLKDRFWFDFSFGTTITPTQSTDDVTLVTLSTQGFDHFGSNDLEFRVDYYYHTVDDDYFLRVQSYRHLLYDYVYEAPGGALELAAIYPTDPDQNTVDGTLTLVEGTDRTDWDSDLSGGDLELRNSWVITHKARPSRTLKEIDTSLRNAGAGNLDYGLRDPDAVTAYRELAQNGNTPQERIAGVLMLVYSANNEKSS